jgi:cell division septal protein FtsQ
MGSILSPRALGHRMLDISKRPELIGRQRVHGASARRLRWFVRRVGLGLTIGGAVIGGALAIHLALTSSYFAVDVVEVQGAHRVGTAAIIQAAAIAPGTNVFRVDARAVARRVEALPQVRRVEIVRALPNRLTVVVEERRPFTLVHAGRLHWIDEDGVPIGVERRAVTAPVPVISGLSPEELATMRDRPSPKARTAIALIRTLLRSGSPLTAEISEVDVSGTEGPVLYTVDGVEVRLGTEGWESRLHRLEGVLVQVAREPEPVTAIDLRFRDQVVLTR